VRTYLASGLDNERCIRAAYELHTSCWPRNMALTALRHTSFFNFFETKAYVPHSAFVHALTLILILELSALL